MVLEKQCRNCMFNDICMGDITSMIGNKDTCSQEVDFDFTISWLNFIDMLTRDVLSELQEWNDDYYWVEMLDHKIEYSSDILEIEKDYEELSDWDRWVIEDPSDGGTLKFQD